MFRPLLRSALALRPVRVGQLSRTVVPSLVAAPHRSLSQAPPSAVSLPLFPKQKKLKRDWAIYLLVGASTCSALLMVKQIVDLRKKTAESDAQLAQEAQELAAEENEQKGTSTYFVEQAVARLSTPFLPAHSDEQDCIPGLGLEQHEALTRLLWSTSSRGLWLLEGPSGCGKTSAVEKALAGRCAVVWSVHSERGDEPTLGHVLALRAFGVNVPASLDPLAVMEHALQEFRGKRHTLPEGQRTPIIVVDDAELLLRDSRGRSLLEWLAVLSVDSLARVVFVSSQNIAAQMCRLSRFNSRLNTFRFPLLPELTVQQALTAIPADKHGFTAALEAQIDEQADNIEEQLSEMSGPQLCASLHVLEQIASQPRILVHTLNALNKSAKQSDSALVSSVVRKLGTDLTGLKLMDRFIYIGSDTFRLLDPNHVPFCGQDQVASLLRHRIKIGSTSDHVIRAKVYRTHNPDFRMWRVMQVRLQPKGEKTDHSLARAQVQEIEESVRKAVSEQFKGKLQRNGEWLYHTEAGGVLSNTAARDKLVQCVQHTIAGAEPRPYRHADVLLDLKERLPLSSAIILELHCL